MHRAKGLAAALALVLVLVTVGAVTTQDPYSLIPKGSNLYTILGSFSGILSSSQATQVKNQALTRYEAAMIILGLAKKATSDPALAAKHGQNIAKVASYLPNEMVMLLGSKEVYSGLMASLGNKPSQAMPATGSSSSSGKVTSETKPTPAPAASPKGSSAKTAVASNASPLRYTEKELDSLVAKKVAEAIKKERENSGVEIHGSTSIHFLRSDASGQVPVDPATGEPLYKPDRQFNQSFNLNLSGKLGNGSAVNASFAAETEGDDGLLLSDGLTQMDLTGVSLHLQGPNGGSADVGTIPGVKLGKYSMNLQNLSGLILKTGGKIVQTTGVFSRAKKEEIPTQYARWMYGTKLATGDAVTKALKGFSAAVSVAGYFDERNEAIPGIPDEGHIAELDLGGKFGDGKKIGLDFDFTAARSLFAREDSIGNAFDFSTNLNLGSRVAVNAGVTMMDPGFENAARSNTLITKEKEEETAAGLLGTGELELPNDGQNGYRVGANIALIPNSLNLSAAFSKNGIGTAEETVSGNANLTWAVKFRRTVEKVVNQVQQVATKAKGKTVMVKKTVPVKKAEKVEFGGLTVEAGIQKGISYVGAPAVTTMTIGERASVQFAGFELQENLGFEKDDNPADDKSVVKGGASLSRPINFKSGVSVTPAVSGNWAYDVKKPNKTNGGDVTGTLGVGIPLVKNVATLRLNGNVGRQFNNAEDTRLDENGQPLMDYASIKWGAGGGLDITVPFRPLDGLRLAGMVSYVGTIYDDPVTHPNKTGYQLDTSASWAKKVKDLNITVSHTRSVYKDQRDSNQNRTTQNTSISGDYQIPGANTKVQGHWTVIDSIVPYKYKVNELGLMFSGGF